MPVLTSIALASSMGVSVGLYSPPVEFQWIYHEPGPTTFVRQPRPIRKIKRCRVLHKNNKRKKVYRYYPCRHVSSFYYKKNKLKKNAQRSRKMNNGKRFKKNYGYRS